MHRRQQTFPFYSTIASTSMALLFAIAPFMDALATPVPDPICGVPSSLQIVQAVREQAARWSRRSAGLLAQPGLMPTLGLDRSTRSGLPQFVIGGSAGQWLELETTSDLASGNWRPWLTVAPSEQPLTWTDPASSSAQARFFRLRKGDPEVVSEPAANFRLLDERGISRDLYYHTHLQAIAVISVGNDLRQAAASLPLLSELAGAYTNRLEIWFLLSDSSPVRSNILAQAQALQVPFPVLLDPNGLAARSVGLTRAGEAALVAPPAFTVAYRGEIAGEGQTTAAESMLGQAIAALTANQTPRFVRTPGPGPTLSHVGDKTPDYATEIAPVLAQYCAPCHRPNGVAPFAMTSHSVVETWALNMKHALLSGMMPPWHADREYGHFANDLSLPGALKAALIRWIDAGTPRGEGADPLEQLPVQPKFDEWPEDLGAPDALVTIPLQPIKDFGLEPYRYIFVQAPNPTNVSLRAAIIRPSNYKAVHHILVWLGRIGNTSTTANSSTYQSHIAEYVPGIRPFRIPADAGVTLTKSNWLTFNLHYNTYGETTNDAPVLALWYHKTKPQRTWISTAVSDLAIRIRPGVREHPAQASWSVPGPIMLHRFNPHMHLRGKRMKYEVIYPDRTREVLLSVPDYDFNWQVGYDLANPKLIPSGSTIVVSGAFDNSPQNLANPDPTATVTWGDQSSMEMFAGFIDYTQ